jgi:predicted homoserine dehydrogenase-like protein
MVIVDTALEKRHQAGKPIRIALIGAGYMARGIALELLTGIKGICLAVIANRTLDAAARAYAEAGIDDVTSVDTLRRLEDVIASGAYAITDDALLACQASGIDAIIEATGDVEHSAHVVLKAIEHGKHVILMNAELDATIGPILKVYADRAGVVITNTDGDEPGVAMNLYRFVKTIGYQPVLAGNIKGFIDPYRTPETQRDFAERHNQKPPMITSFADGTKLSMETTILANATGFHVGKRGMYGHRCMHVKDILNHFSPEQLLSGGLVDYALGAEPGTGAFVVGYSNHSIKQQYLRYFKMGDGPLYLFYTPYHLPHIQLPLTVARAALFQDATVAPIGAPACDVITIAKRDLKAGEALDGIGGFTCYGAIENADIAQSDNLLPMGLSRDCRLKRDIPKDQLITYADISLPKGRLSDTLRAEQNAYFATSTLTERGSAAPA